MARVLRTPRALEDLRSLSRYLSRESGSVDVGRRFIRRIKAKCKVYASNPELGEECPDLAADVRCTSIGSYIVYYRPLADRIEVLRVLHGSRDIPKAWLSE